MPKKTEMGGDPLGFFNIHSVAKHQKIAGGPFGEKFNTRAKIVKGVEQSFSRKMALKVITRKTKYQSVF